MTTHYRSAMSKLSAYMIVFLERNLNGMNWETRNAKLIDETYNEKRKFKMPTILRYYECLILSVVCYVCYFNEYAKNRDIDVQTVCFLCFPLLLVIWEILITKRINSMDKERHELINRWEQIANENHHSSN